MEVRKPVFIGDTIRVRVTIESVKPMRRAGGGLVNLKMEVINQDDEICHRGSWDILCKGKEEG